MRKRFKIFSVLFVFAALLSTQTAWAENVSVADIQYQRLASDRYEVSAKILNRTEDHREAIVRANIAFYDNFAPDGDVPVSVLVKDKTFILKPWDTQTLKTVLIHEGSELPGNLHETVNVRIRREREWNY